MGFSSSARLARFVLFGFRLLGLPAGLLGFTLSTAVAQYEFEGPPINYRDRAMQNSVARLDERIRAGEVELVQDENGSYLRSLLKELDIPLSSQTLVFSKTSLQQGRISPQSPRAVYFNDDCYIGWVPGGLIEIAVMDDKLGGVFYTLRDRDPSASLLRDRGGCLGCHSTGRTKQVPGFFVRSIPPDEEGRPRDIGYVSDHRSDFETRWGGWYVTGTHGTLRHRGNAFALDADNEELVDMEPGANLVSLSERFATDRYLTPHSDLVALMVMEHQSQMHNLITAANYETIKATDSDRTMNQALDRPADFQTESTVRRIHKAGDKLVEYLFMKDELQLKETVAGTSGYAEEFSARGPHDSQGRSLRQLDLGQRLFRYPCSFLIYSPALAALPEPMLAYVRDRIQAVLRGEDPSGSFGHLTAEDRQAITEILAETGPKWLGMG
jgi:hypothetical protein